MQHFLYLLVIPLLVLGSLVVSGSQNGDVQEQQRKSKTTVYPTILYPGENVLTFSNPDGIQEIKPMFDSLALSLTELTIPDIGTECSDSVQFYLKVNTVSQAIAVRFMVTSCSKNRQVFALKVFNCVLEEFFFPDATVGDTVCKEFRLGLSSSEFNVGQYIIDSIVPPAPNVVVSVDSWPIPMESGTVYNYMVCFVAMEPGIYRFGVPVWMRRSQSAGGYTTYAVADTGIVRVVPKESDPSPSPGGMRDR